MLRAIKDTCFADIATADRSAVLEVVPDVHIDTRGTFSEVLAAGALQDIDSCDAVWLSSFEWLKQINRSTSAANVLRGCHAQIGAACQGKLVEALTAKVIDVIADARPESATFGKSKAYVLDPKLQNKVWVPRGFLHAFFVPDCGQECDAVFQYFCDNVYQHSSELCINPMSIVPDAIKQLAAQPGNRWLEDTVAQLELAVTSEKDLTGGQWSSWIDEAASEYAASGRSWWRA